MLSTISVSSIPEADREFLMECYFRLKGLSPGHEDLCYIEQRPDKSYDIHSSDSVQRAFLTRFGGDRDHVIALRNYGSRLLQQIGLARSFRPGVIVRRSDADFSCENTPTGCIDDYIPQTLGTSRKSPITENQQAFSAIQDWSSYFC